MLEFNVRFGDPETQVVLPRLRSDLLDLLMRATEPGGLAGVELEWDERAAVTVVLASRGLPGVLLARATSSPGSTACRTDVEVLHAGTAEAGGDDRHRGRPRAQRDRARRRRPVPPGTPRMLPPT